MREKYSNKINFHKKYSNHFKCKYILNNVYVYDLNIDICFSMAFYLYFHTVHNVYVCEYSLFLRKNETYYSITIETSYSYITLIAP